MNRLLVLFLLVILDTGMYGLIHTQENPVAAGSIPHQLYPGTTAVCPDIDSPARLENGMEVVTGYYSTENKYTIIPVTVENGDYRNYKKNQWGKGRQLKIDGEDFPALVQTGLHSEAELDAVRVITGRSVVDITEDGRPGRSSREGFLAEDEDIVSVLKGDNRVVRKLGLTHPRLAVPLFHLWNIIQKHDARMRQIGRPLPVIDQFSYNDRTIYITNSESGKGWQESLFNDGNLGMWQFEIMIKPTDEELLYLQDKYSHLTEKQFSDLLSRLTCLHTGEMVPFYIMRYGFYEGHTSYRADPIATAFIFGLRTIQEIDASCSGDMYRWLTAHYTSHADGRKNLKR